MPCPAPPPRCDWRAAPVGLECLTETLETQTIICIVIREKLMKMWDRINCIKIWKGKKDGKRGEGGEKIKEFSGEG